MLNRTVDYSRLIHLNQKVKDGTANKLEKDEYMAILFANGNITSSQYEKYKKDSTNEELLKAALAIGGVVLVSYLVSKLFSN